MLGLRPDDRVTYSAAWRDRWRYSGACVTTSGDRVTPPKPPGPASRTPRNSGIPELIAFAYVGNQRSLNVMKKLGMECVGEFDHPGLRAGPSLRRHALYYIRTE